MSATSTADRNLLFGILALQMDFIDREQLIGAMSAWVLEKTKSLGQILCEKRSLLVGDRHLIDQLVERHLQRHGADVQRSLASIRVDPGLCREIENRTDSEVQASLASLQTPPPRDGVSTPPPATVHVETEVLIPRGGSRFRVLRPHAKGGLGQVSVAVDDELHREVALKEIQGHLADHPGNRARFLLEAEVTGRLEHPGVVPIYGLGTYPDGRPYYAMRFIHGTSLHEAIRRYHGMTNADASERSLELRGLLGRFVAMCNAVGFGHARGVIHRDLKPANVMLGEYGETLVVDWGLAKVLGSGGEETMQPEPLRISSGSDMAATMLGSIVGTPAFMAPEQANGRHDLVGVCSDVFALGATLYAILTGQSPYGKEDTLAKAREGRFPPPREIHRDVPRALEAICLKAMAMRPEDRYPRAKELARDVERWLADEPVIAYREPLRDRARRWANRNRTLVSVGATLLLAAVIGLSIGLYAVGKEQRETAKERDRAQKNLALARDAVDECFGIAKEHPLLQRENMQQARKLLFEKALAFYKDFREQSDDPALRARQADNFFRVGVITTELGRKTESIAAYEQAREIQEKLVEEYPNEPHYALVLSDTCNNLANLLGKTGRRKEALELYEKSVALLQPLMRDSSDSKYRIALAIRYHNMGGLYRDLDRPEEARKTFLESCSLRERMLEARPGDRDVQMSLAETWSQLASFLKDTNRPEQGWQLFEKARCRQERLLDEDPANRRLSGGLAATFNNLGLVVSELAGEAAAIRYFRKSAELQADLARAEPEVVKYRADLARARNNLGQRLAITGRTREALPMFIQARDVQEQLCSSHPENLEHVIDLGRTYSNLGSYYRVVRLDDRAMGSHLLARRHQQRVVKAHPESSDYLSDLAVTEHNIAFLLRTSNRFEEAVPGFEKAIQAFETLARKRPDVVNFRNLVATTQINFAGLLQDMGRADQALEVLHKARKTLTEVVREYPRVGYHRNNLATTSNNIGNHLQMSGKYAEALPFFEEARDIRVRLIDEQPKVIEYQELLSTTYYGLVLVHNGMGQPDKAIEAYREKHRLDERMAREHPEAPQYRQALGATCNDFGVQLQHAGRFDEAIKIYHHGRDVQEALIKDYPGIPDLRNDLARTHHNLGVTLAEARRPEDACKDYERSRDLRRHLVKEHPKVVKYGTDLADTCLTYGRLLGQMGKVEEARAIHREAIELYDRFLERVKDEEKTTLRIRRAVALVRFGEYERASEDADRLVTPRTPAVVLYDVACVHAYCAAEASRDSARPLAVREKIAQQEAERAMTILRELTKTDYFHNPGTVAHAKADADFTFLRNREDFAMLVKEWEKQAKTERRP